MPSVLGVLLHIFIVKSGEDLDLSYTARYTTFSALDSLLVVSAIFISYLLLHPTLTVYSDTVLVISAVTLLVSHHITAHLFHLYNRLWSLASVKELLIIGYAVTTSVLTAGAMQFVIQQHIYFRVMAITWLLLILLIGGSRFVLRVVHERAPVKAAAEVKRVLIVGAGEAGTMLLRSLKRNPSEYQVVAF